MASAIIQPSSLAPRENDSSDHGGTGAQVAVLDPRTALRAHFEISELGSSPLFSITRDVATGRATKASFVGLAEIQERYENDTGFKRKVEELFTQNANNLSKLTIKNGACSWLLDEALAYKKELDREVREHTKEQKARELSPQEKQLKLLVSAAAKLPASCTSSPIEPIVLNFSTLRTQIGNVLDVLPEGKGRSKTINSTLKRVTLIGEQLLGAVSDRLIAVTQEVVPDNVEVKSREFFGTVKSLLTLHETIGQPIGNHQVQVTAQADAIIDKITQAKAGFEAAVIATKETYPQRLLEHVKGWMAQFGAERSSIFARWGLSQESLKAQAGKVIAAMEDERAPQNDLTAVCNALHSLVTGGVFDHLLHRDASLSGTVAPTNEFLHAEYGYRYRAFMKAWESTVETLPELKKVSPEVVNQFASHALRTIALSLSTNRNAFYNQSLQEHFVDFGNVYTAAIENAWNSVLPRVPGITTSTALRKVMEPILEGILATEPLDVRLLNALSDESDPTKCAQLVSQRALAPALNGLFRTLSTGDYYRNSGIVQAEEVAEEALKRVALSVDRATKALTPTPLVTESSESVHEKPLVVGIPSPGEIFEPLTEEPTLFSGIWATATRIFGGLARKFRFS